MDDKAAWDAAYAKGTWDQLTATLEVAHYATIAGYLHYFLHASDAVLDLGCGEGLLVEYMAPSFYQRYTGIDISDVALAKARARHASRATLDFRCSPIERYSVPPDLKYGAIVFNEVLYYLHDPIGTVTRLSASLGPSGLVIVSMWGGTTGHVHESAIRLWGDLYAIGWPLVDETKLIHTLSGNCWKVAVFRP